jgi:hypothetical protein
MSTKIITLILARTALPSSTSIPPILHYSSAEPFTKYEICLVFAKILGLPHAHIIADAEEPKAGGTVRPKVCLLFAVMLCAVCNIRQYRSLRPNCGALACLLRFHTACIMISPALPLPLSPEAQLIWLFDCSTVIMIG